jgi:hypothetical protein
MVEVSGGYVKKIMRSNLLLIKEAWVMAGRNTRVDEVK